MKYRASLQFIYKNKVIPNFNILPISAGNVP
jgi:hypothetical protein